MVFITSLSHSFRSHQLHSIFLLQLPFTSSPITFWFFISFLLTLSTLYVKFSKVVAFTTMYMLMIQTLSITQDFLLRLWLPFWSFEFPWVLKIQKFSKQNIISTLLYWKVRLALYSSPHWIITPSIQLLTPDSWILSFLWVPQSWHSIAGRSTFPRIHTYFI